MSEWPEVRLGDVAKEITVGHVGPMAHEYRSGGVPFLRSQNILPFRIDLSDVKYISPDFHTRLAKSALRPGDVLTVRTGKPGTTAIVPEDWAAANCSDLVITRPGPRLDGRWFSYYMNSASGYVSNHVVGAVQQHFNVGSAKAMILALPPLAEQRAIADVLGALDDKIAADRRELATTGQLIPALFESSFGGSARKTRLTDLVTVTKGVSYRSSDLAESRTCLVTLKSVGRDGSYQSEGLKAYVGPYKPSQEIRPGETVVAQTDLTQAAEVVGRAVRVPMASGVDRLVASLDLAIVRSSGGAPAEFVFGVLIDRRFREHCRARTSGTTVLHLASDAFSSYFAPEVPAEAQAKFADRIRPLLSRQDALVEESRTLAALRDTLLPALMSGKLRVQDAEDAVSAVV